jgi:NaMN:DMB phosphoribosyltransferase
MSFIDQVYSLYRDHLSDDEDDAVAIVLSILEDQSKDNVMQLITEMGDDEIMQMMGVYLVEMIKMKMVQDGKLPQWKPVILSHYH